MANLNLDFPVMFYDGECGLCARGVQWCLKHDHLGILKFAPLQGQTYSEFSGSAKQADLTTMVVWEAGKVHLRSDATLAMLRSVGGFWKVLGTIGKVCPRFIRDGMYNFIAKRRIGWFGTAQECHLPTPEQRERILP